jgi:hypothetical protein
MSIKKSDMVYYIYVLTWTLLKESEENDEGSQRV